MSSKTPLTASVGSQLKNKFISWAIDNNCEINKSPGKNQAEILEKVDFNGND